MDDLISVPRQSGIAAADVQRQKVMLALPFYKSTNPLTMFSLMQLYDKRRMSIALNFGDAFVIHSRNTCAAAFLESDMEWMFTADDDVILPAGTQAAKWYNAHTGFNLPEKFAGLHAIDRLLASGKTLIGGLYWGRGKNGNAMYSEGCNFPEEAAYARKGPYDLIKRTKWVATGALLIHRSVFESIEKKFPRLGRQVGSKKCNFFSPSEYEICEVVDQVRAMLAEGPMTGEKAMKAYEALERGSASARTSSGLGQGEDVAFSIRAAAAGHPAHVDMGLVVGHIGSEIFGPYNTSPKPKQQ